MKVTFVYHMNYLKLGMNKMKAFDDYSQVSCDGCDSKSKNQCCLSAPHRCRRMQRDLLHAGGTLCLHSDFRCTNRMFSHMFLHFLFITSKERSLWEKDVPLPENKEAINIPYTMFLALFLSSFLKA